MTADHSPAGTTIQQSPSPSPSPRIRWQPIVAHVHHAAQTTGHAFASLLFLPGWKTGLVLLLSTVVVPNAALSGLAALLLAALLRQLLHISDNTSLANSLLLGLALGLFFPVSAVQLTLLASGVLLCLMLELWLGTLLHQYGLPLWCWPFVFTSLLILLSAQAIALPYQAALHIDVMSSTTLSSIVAQWLTTLSIPVAIQSFLLSLGMLLFVPSLFSGSLLAVILCWQSPYRLLLAIGGFSSGYALLYLLSPGHADALSAQFGFNLILSALAIGGVYIQPGWRSFALAMGSAALTAVLALALQHLLAILALPVLALPFLCAASLSLLLLRKRRYNHAPFLFNDTGELPEQRLGDAQLALARGCFALNLYAPVAGQWQIYQGVDGEYTHQGPWRHALDFHQLHQGQSFSGEGNVLQDYFCFGQPVYAPANGIIVAADDSHPDNPPGNTDTRHNWGNHVLIRMHNGLHVLLCHLQQHSLVVRYGDPVSSGQHLANCGNSGRSPQPHLHMHVQQGSILGEATIAFALTDLIQHHTHDEVQRHYHLSWVPNTGDTLERAWKNVALRESWPWQVGRTLAFDWHTPDGHHQQRSLFVELTLAGQLRLSSDSGASCALTDTGDALFLHDRRGPRDLFLDGFMLALGVSPHAEGALSWHDAPRHPLMPTKPWQRLLHGICHPFGNAIHSHYQRHWLRVPAQWQQSAEHSLQLTPDLPGIQAWQHHVQTEALLSEQGGLTMFTLRLPAQSHSAPQLYRAHLCAYGLRSDQGIPAWQTTHQDTSSITPLLTHPGSSTGALS